MADVLTSAALWVVQQLLGLLPASPFTTWLSGLSTQLEGVRAGLAALNWLVDVQGMVTLLILWLAAAEVYMIANLGINSYTTLRRTVRTLVTTGRWWDIMTSIIGD